RLGLHSAGLPAALLHAGRCRRRPGPDGHADRAGPVGPLAAASGGRRAEPHAGGRQHAGRHVLRGRRLPFPPRNVTAYAVALATSGVQVRERLACIGLLTDGDAVTGAATSAGPICAPLVVLTGGPELAEVAALAGIRVPTGGVRHQVAVTQRHPDLHPSRLPMVFDLSAGLYWRPEEGGMLFGMSNPDERPARPAAWTS